MKFQSFKATAITTKKALQANYQLKNSKNNESPTEILKNLNLIKINLNILKSCCIKNNIEFLSTAFDIESLEMLNSLNMERNKNTLWRNYKLSIFEKIGSYDKTYYSFNRDG